MPAAIYGISDPLAKSRGVRGVWATLSAVKWVGIHSDSGLNWCLFVMKNNSGFELVNGRFTMRKEFRVKSPDSYS